jgi:glycosyltransferase involved in cell wall biosynthesis
MSLDASSESPEPMRVLVVSPHPIFPLSHGGRVRTFGLASGLARAGAAVDLLGPWAPGQPLRPQVREGVRCRARAFATAPLLALSDDVLPSSIPFSWEARLPLVAPVLRHAEGYDVIQVEMAGGDSWFERAVGSPARVYDAQNVESDFARDRAAGSSLRRRMTGRVANLERRVVQSSDLVLTCTDGDANRLAELYGLENRTAAIPNGFDDALLKLDRQSLRARARERLGARHDERLLLFVGGAADHNLESVRVLERSLVPQLRPMERLLVAGKASRALSSGEPAVTALGYVPDMGELLAAADVALNPVPYGSGSNVKVAEYLAAGLPVVSTPVGARGFERWSDRIRLAEPADLAAAVRDTPKPSGPPPGIEELAWSSIGRRLHERYRALLEERSSSSRPSSISSRR